MYTGDSGDCLDLIEIAYYAYVVSGCLEFSSRHPLVPGNNRLGVRPMAGRK